MQVAKEGKEGRASESESSSPLKDKTASSSSSKSKSKKESALAGAPKEVKDEIPSPWYECVCWFLPSVRVCMCVCVCTYI